MRCRLGGLIGGNSPSRKLSCNVNCGNLYSEEVFYRLQDTTRDILWGFSDRYPRTSYYQPVNTFTVILP